MASRLAKLPAAVWRLHVDWRRFAADLDQAASAQVLLRNRSQEKKAHEAISLHLRRAAALLQLKANGQVNPMLAGTLEAVARQSERLRPFVTVAPALRSLPHERWKPPSPDAPRLSDLLNEVAILLEGEQRQLFGLHRAAFAPPGQLVGAAGAASVAFDRVVTFLTRHTKKTHLALATEIVSAYHGYGYGVGQLPPPDWASAWRKRQKAKHRKVEEK